MNQKELLIKNIEYLHTTEAGEKRIKRNLGIDADDVVSYCKKLILMNESVVVRSGKNFYLEEKNIRLTISAYKYTIITAHKI